MNTHLLALQLMAAQGILGAFDTIYHHELTEALHQRSTARKELAIHAIRAIIYSILFIGLSAWSWHGTWSIVLLAVFGIEIILTLWDFVIEDKTRLLPATERVTHTILAINGGAFITLLVLNTPAWLAQPTALAWTPHGWLGLFLALCGIGVGLSGIRDGIATYQLGMREKKEKSLPVFQYSDKAENVLVTGGTGFIGKLLVRSLLADGQNVTVLSRNPKQAAWLFNGKVRCIDNLRELPPGYHIDTIINLAGARVLGWRWTSKQKAYLRHSRIGLTQQLIDWIATAHHKPRLLLSASAIGYYGVQKNGDDTKLTEDSPPQSIFMSQLCQEWETVASRATEYGVHVKFMRLGLVLGREGSFPMMMLPIKLGLGGPLGSGRQWLSWIHVHDVLRGIAHLSKLSIQGTPAQPLAEAYNFTAPEPLPQKQFSQTAAQVVHRPCFFPTPDLPMRLLLGEQADLLIEGQRVIPERLQKSGFTFTYPDCFSAVKSFT
jgi:uncharacterized protein (TIGR01777 family)